MVSIMHVDTLPAENERNSRVYSGDLIIIRGHPRMADFLAMLRTRCRTYLSKDPERIHRHESDAKVEGAFAQLRANLRQDEQVNNAWRTTLAEMGVDVDVTYGDGVVVRGQTPHSNRVGSRLAPLSAHRDTWGSHIAAQTNWWAPLYATTPERTLALYPGYFERSVANDSAGWDFRLMVKAQKSNRIAEYPHLPTVHEAPPVSEALAISLFPGDLLCFSGAHLHATVPNTTELTRLSFETRTVNGNDAMAGIGAPNVDGGATYTAYQLFTHLTDGEKLGKLTANAGN